MSSHINATAAVVKDDDIMQTYQGNLFRLRTSLDDCYISSTVHQDSSTRYIFRCPCTNLEFDGNATLHECQMNVRTATFYLVKSVTQKLPFDCWVSFRSSFRKKFQNSCFFILAFFQSLWFLPNSDLIKWRLESGYETNIDTLPFTYFHLFTLTSNGHLQGY